MESELQSQTDSQTALEAKFEKLVGSQREQSTPRQTLKCTLKTSLCIWNGLSAPAEQPGLGFTQLWYSGNKFKSFLQWKILMLKLTAPLTAMFSKTIVYLVTEGGGRDVHVMVYHRHWDGYSNVFYVLLMHVDLNSFFFFLVFSHMHGKQFVQYLKECAFPCMPRWKTLLHANLILFIQIQIMIDNQKS